MTEPTKTSPDKPNPPAEKKTGSKLSLKWLIPLAIILFLSVVLNVYLLDQGQMIDLFGSPSVTDLEAEHHSLKRYAPNKVAILRLEGTILEGEGSYFKKQIDEIRADDSIKAIVLRINSPGGSVSASDYLYHHLKQLCRERKIPMVVSMGFLTASGGYYVAMAAGEQKEYLDEKDFDKIIYAEPTTWCGSIGVYIPQYNAKELADKIGVEDNTIATHPLKLMGSMFKEMTEQEREVWEGLLNETFDRFKQVVMFGRPELTKAEVDEVATGQIFTTTQALENGLADEEGFLEDAIDRAIELAKLKKSDVSVIEYDQPLTLVDALMGSSTQVKPQGIDWQSLQQLNTPQAYYLWSRFPPLAEMTKALANEPR